jgi:hypothetical protein
VVAQRAKRPGALIHALLWISVLILAHSVPLLAQSSPPLTHARPAWIGQEERIETVLASGTVVHQERIPRGITRPWKIELELDGERLAAIWKPIPTQVRGLESYQAEIAAYRLSRHLGLDMVPPTVERRIGHRWGSLQLWIDGVKHYADVLAEQPDVDAITWSQQVARMRFFDRLIDNPDRHAANILVDASHNLILIDHSRALTLDGTAPATAKIVEPVRFDLHLIAGVRELDLPRLRTLLGDLMSGDRLRALDHIRTVLLTTVDDRHRALGDLVFFKSP